jgi:hypothetical protein
MRKVIMVTFLGLLVLFSRAFAQTGPYGRCYIALSNGTQVHVGAWDYDETLCFKLQAKCTPPGTSGRIHYVDPRVIISTPYRECNAIRP